MSARKRIDRTLGERLGATGWAGVALAAFVFALGWYVCARRFGLVGGLLGWWPSAIVAAVIGLAPIALVRRIRGRARRPTATPPKAEAAKRPKIRQAERIVSNLPAD